MTELPALPEFVRRKLAVHWEELADNHSSELQLHETQRARAQIRTGHLKVSYEVAVGEHLVKKTISLAETRFEQNAEEYLRLWASADDARAKTFAEWLNEIQANTVAEISTLWATRESYAALFESACRRRVEEQLRALVQVWKSRARKLEIHHLEYPHLSVESLLASGGDLSLALTFEQSKTTIESAQDFLNRLRAIDVLSDGNSKGSEGPQGVEQISAIGVHESPRQETSSRSIISEEEPQSGSVKEDPKSAPTSRKRGYEADMVEHNRIAAIVERHDGNWRNESSVWRREAILKLICSDLDQAEIDILEGWLTGRTQSLRGVKLRNWSDAFTLGYKKLLVDHIRYRLKMVSRALRAASAKT